MVHTARKNDNLLPDVELPEQKPIGKYGKMHLDYLKQHRRGRYSTLLGEGRLNTYLSEIDEQANEMLTSLTVEFARLKASTNTSRRPTKCGGCR